MTTDIRSGALEELLSHYACARLGPPLHALVAAHLALSPRNRAFVRALEQAASQALDAASGVPVSDQAGMLAAIFAAPVDAPLPVAPKAETSACPEPLASLLPGVGVKDLRDMPWKRLLPSVKRIVLPDHPEHGAATFYWIRAGARLPAHTHAGQEVTLVLQGAFSDGAGHYKRGDIAIADAEIDHRPVVDAYEDCFCFAVTDAPLLLTGPIGRVVQRVFGGQL
jgi:putative transcriptional regulator